MDPNPAFLVELTEQERVHFRNLALIRPQLPSEGQLRLIEGLSLSLVSRRLLTLIARTPHWLLHGPILEALAENEHTPEPIRRDLEMAVSLVDLMREMDRAPANEKEERADTVKAIYAQLPPDLKPIVKQQLKLLAKQVQSTGLTQEMPPLPSDEQDWDALTRPPEATVLGPRKWVSNKTEGIEKAASTHVPEELEEALLSEFVEFRQAALRNPVLTEDLLIEVMGRSHRADFFEDVCSEARWYFRDSVRAAIYDAPCAPQTLTRRMRIASDLAHQLMRDDRTSRSLHRISSLFTQLEESEYQFLTFWAKKHAPSLMRVIKVFYDRLQRKRVNRSSGFATRPTESRWSSFEERVFMANQATQPDHLVTALKDPDLKVFTIVLENPGLGLRELLSVVPVLDLVRAEKLATHYAWGTNSAVGEALIHNPKLSEATGLRLLPLLDTPRALMDLLRDSRIPHMRVKQQALEALRTQYLSMNSDQRVVALRQSGGEFIRHLPQEVLKDEETLHQLISDRQVDPNILLRLARNKQSPRSILSTIASHPTLLAHPPIMQELLLNPKTPRESALRLWGLLSESEQQQLLRSPHLPSTLRML